MNFEHSEDRRMLADSLNRFISELGKLPPKRTTRLQQKTHRHLCRQIKVQCLC